MPTPSMHMALAMANPAGMFGSEPRPISPVGCIVDQWIGDLVP